MAFCRAYPAKKVPVDRLSASRCQERGFEQCPFYAEVEARLASEDECEACPCAAAAEAGSEEPS